VQSVVSTQAASSSTSSAAKTSVATAHAQLVSAGVRDAGRAATALRQVEAAYAAAVSAGASPRPKSALAEQLKQLQRAVRADLVRAAHPDRSAGIPDVQRACLHVC
jgi:hypothetical protein